MTIVRVHLFAIFDGFLRMSRVAQDLALKPRTIAPTVLQISCSTQAMILDSINTDFVKGTVTRTMIVKDILSAESETVMEKLKDVSEMGREVLITVDYPT
mmetsp:Transcript_14541/g.24873  ORF Transcript_14541/g.24873 Transcript_14541/m.24873 type:complete len:100 (-) Transcript_14541:788-1087(-)